MPGKVCVGNGLVGSGVEKSAVMVILGVMLGAGVDWAGAGKLQAANRNINRQTKINLVSRVDMAFSSRYSLNDKIELKWSKKLRSTYKTNRFYFCSLIEIK